MHARLSALETDRAEAQRAQLAAQERAMRAEGALACAQQQLASASAPQRYVLEQLAAASERVEAAEARVTELEVGRRLSMPA